MSDVPQAPAVPMEGMLNGLPLQILAGATGPAAAVARVLSAWMRRLGDGSPRTAQSYGREARMFLAFIEQARGPLPGGLLAATPSDVAAFVHLVPGIAPGTRAIKCAVLRSLFGALVVEELMPTNPAAEVRVRHVQSGKHHRAVPQSQIITTLERLAQSQRPQDIRDRALILLALTVAHMPEEDLAHVLGLSPGPARRLAAALELHRRLVNWSVPIRPILKTPEDAMAVLTPMCSYAHERFWCLALDVRCRLIASPIEVSRGDVDGTDAGPRAFFRAALCMGATSVIAAHNHPSGDVTPSSADLAVTRRLVAAGRTIDVPLVDHVIIAADRRWRSMRRDDPACFC